MHNILLLASCIGAMLLAWLGVSLDSPEIMLVILLTVCLVGVPHGGLDHLSGRQWFASRWGNFWFVPFFAAYLGIALVPIFGWLLFPLSTAISFFMISAHHFGRDEQFGGPVSLEGTLAAIASGGLVIWIPAIARPFEMQRILQAIIPTEIGSSSEVIMLWTQILAAVFASIALANIAYSVLSPVARSRGGMMRALRQFSLVCLFAATPIPFSFCLFFCGWHSIRGLRQLMQYHRMSLKQLALASLPMSLGAIGLCGLGMWFWSGGRELHAELTRTLFLGLSGMAVPHLVLHDFMPMVIQHANCNAELQMRSVS